MKKRDKSFKGFEVTLNRIKMEVKMYLVTLLFLIVLHLLAFFAVSYAFLPEGSIYYVAKYIRSSMLAPLSPNLPIDFEYEGETHKIPAAQLKKALTDFAEETEQKLWKYFRFSAFIYLLYPALIVFYHRKAKDMFEKEYVRGSDLMPLEKLNRKMKKIPAYLPIGEMKMPVSSEPEHCFIVGGPGAGKTNLISQIIEKMKQRKNKGVIYDFKGDYLKKFYDPEEDIIFNPLDSRCRGWNLFNEIKTVMDVDAVAHSLIPQAHSQDTFWNDAARDVFSGILRYLHQNKLRSNRDIWNAVTAPGKEISEWLKSTPGGQRGYRYIEDPSSKQAMSVFAVMMQYAKAFEYMALADGDSSIGKWLESNKPGFIFVTNYADVRDTLRPILSLFVDLLGRKLLSMPDDRDRRIFFMLDEFGTLQRLSTIVNLLTMSRSKGGSVWIGIQDIGQVDKIYTRELRQSILNSCGSNIIGYLADPDTAEYFSKRLGKTTFFEADESQHMGPSMEDGRLNISQRKKEEWLILPSEIMHLPKFECFVKVPGFPFTRTRVTRKDYADIVTPFEIRDGLSLDI